MLWCKNDTGPAVVCPALWTNVTGSMVTSGVMGAFYFHFSPFKLVISFFEMFKNTVVPREGKNGDFIRFGLLCHFSMMVCSAVPVSAP